MLKVTSTVAVVVLCAQMLCAQHQSDFNNHSLISVAKDLPDKRVTGIVQDARGFIWISTFNGLYRYDGVGYKAFKNSPLTENKISFNLIGRMKLVFGHFLLLEGDRQVDILDINTEQLIYSSREDKVFLKSIIHGDWCFLHFEDEALKTFLFRFLPDGSIDSLSPFVPDSLRFDRACCDAHGVLYFFDRKGRLWKSDGLSPDLTCIDSTTYRDRRVLYFPALTCDQTDHLWVFDNATDEFDGMYRLDTASRLEKKGNLTSLNTLIPRNTPGEFWLFNISTKLLSVLNVNNGTRTGILYLPEDVPNVSTVIRDLQGNLWIGSQVVIGDGLLLAHPHLPAFHKILYQPGKESTLGIACRGMAELKSGDILIGSKPGMYVFSPEADSARQLSLIPEDTEMTSENIWQILPDPDGRRVWFTREEGGIFEYNPGDPHVRNYVPMHHISDRFYGLALDQKGYLWIGTASGITWFDTKSRTFDLLPEVSAAFYQVSSYNWVATDQNTFWLCSSNGLYRFDTTRHRVARYATDTDPYLNSDQVYDIVKDRDAYWIATDDGLHRLQGDSITIYTTADGLARNAIASLALDNAENLWIATFGGLSKRDPRTGSIQNFYIEDGLPHNEFNRLGKMKTRDGRLFFGTQNGVVYFNPAEVSKTVPAYPLVLTGFSTFSLDGKLMRSPVEILDSLNDITIPAGNKYFEAEFALLNYINSTENRYSYYMEGLENSWRPLTTIPVIQYNNLPAGSYTLHIRGQSPSGQWSINTLDIHVHILQHYYQTALFKIALILLVIALAYFILRTSIMQRLKMERMRNRISSDLHDEVGGVLSGVAMQMDILQKRAPEDLSPFMRRVAESSRNAASKMRDVIWSIDSGKDHFQDLIDRMKAYTVELLAPLDINYKFHLTGIDPRQKLKVDLRQNLYLIFKEALNNIIKHAQASDVVIELSVRRKALTLRITDNGVGLRETTRSEGQGLENMRKRAQRIGAVLQITPRSEGGTVVELVTNLS